MAYGEQRYIDMAKTLAKSLQLHNDKIPRAIVTDSKDSELSKLYHLCLPVKPELGNGFRQKLYIDQYSPFEETLYIDSDCIVVNNIKFIWDFFSKVSFGVVGYQKREGKAFADILDVSDMISILGLSSLPVFNGGIYYYKNNAKAAQVFSEARRIEKDYESLGIGKFRESIADEPVFAIALALCGIEAVQDPQGLTMRTPLNMTGSLQIDVLKGYCQFIKEGQLVQPAIAHFCGSFAEGFYYHREKLKLDLLQFNLACVGRLSLYSHLLQFNLACVGRLSLYSRTLQGVGIFISLIANLALPFRYPDAAYRGLKNAVKRLLKKG